MLKFRNEEGLTLIELLIVIALVGIVSAIALPILFNTVSDSKTKADNVSADERANFQTQWSAAGYDVVANGSGFDAFVHGTTTNPVASIK